MSGQLLYQIPTHQRTGWNSLCGHARGIRDRVRDAIVVVYKGSQTRIKRKQKRCPMSMIFQIDFWIVMIAALVLPIYLFIKLNDWINRFHSQDDYELGPGVNKHPYFMVTAFGVLMPYALLVYRVLRLCPYILLTVAHTILHLVILILVIMGLVYGIGAHTGSNVPTIPHLYSLHSLVGLLAMLFFFFEFVFGLYCGIAHICKCEVYKALHIHRILGLMTYFLGFWTIMTGFTQIPYYIFYWLYHEGIPEAITINNLGLWTALISAVVMFAAARRKYQLGRGVCEFKLSNIFKSRCLKRCSRDCCGDCRNCRGARKARRGKTRCTCNV